MEGYVMIQNEKGMFGMASYVKKYLYVDPHENMILIYDHEPPMRGQDPAISEIHDIPSQMEAGDIAAVVVDIIDFESVTSVAWLSDKKEGRRFNITYGRSSTQHSGSVLRLLSSETYIAQKWVEVINRCLYTSQASAAHSATAGRVSLPEAGMDPSVKSIVDQFSPRPSTKREMFRQRPRGKNEVISYNMIADKLHEEIRLRESIDALNLGEESFVLKKRVKRSGSVEVNRKGSAEKIGSLAQNLRRPSLTVEDAVIQRRKSSRSLKLVITPMKEAIWNLIQLYHSVYSEHHEDQEQETALVHKTKQVVHDIQNRKGVNEAAIRKVLVEDPLIENSVSADSDRGSEYSAHSMYMSDSDWDNIDEIEFLEFEDELDHDSKGRNKKDAAIEAASKNMSSVLSLGDLSKIVNGMQENCKLVSLKYNYRTYTHLLKGSELIRYFLQDCPLIRCKDRHDVFAIANLLLRKGFILLFPPPWVRNMSQPTKTPAFMEEGFYCFKMGHIEQDLAKLAHSVHIENFDFWLRVMKDAIPLVKAHIGNLKRVKCYKGARMLHWAMDQAFCSKQEHSTFFFSYALQKGALVDLGDSEATLFSESGHYQVDLRGRTIGTHSSSRRQSTDTEASAALNKTITIDVDGNQSITLQGDSHVVPFLRFVDHLTDPDFIEFFCLKQDDASVLRALLSVFSKRKHKGSTGSRKSSADSSNWSPPQSKTSKSIIKKSGRSSSIGESETLLMRDIPDLGDLKRYSQSSRDIKTTNEKGSPKSSPKARKTPSRMGTLQRITSGMPFRSVVSELNDRNFTTIDVQDEEDDNVRVKKRQQDTLFSLLVEYSCTSIDKVAKAFELEDEVAHGLAIDVIWELLKREILASHFCRQPLACSKCMQIDDRFYAMCRTYLSGERCTHRNSQLAVLSAMIDQVWSEHKPDRPMNSTVIRPGLWKSYFTVLNGASVSVLEAGLNDAFYLIIDNYSNCKDILIQKNWYQWVLPYALLKDSRHQECAELAQNFIIRVLFQAMARSDHFDEALSSILYALNEKQMKAKMKTPIYLNVAFSIIRMLASLINNKSQSFSSQVSLNDSLYSNYVLFCKRVLRFLFASSKWGTYGYTPDKLYHGLHRFESDLYFSQTQHIIETIHRIYQKMQLDPHTTTNRSELQVLHELEPLKQHFQAASNMINMLALHNTERYTPAFLEEAFRKLASKSPKKKSSWVLQEFSNMLDKFIRQ